MHEDVDAHFLGSEKNVTGIKGCSGRLINTVFNVSEEKILKNFKGNLGIMIFSVLTF